VGAVPGPGLVEPAGRPAGSRSRDARPADGAPVVAATPVAPPRPRTVKEICAGRNLISQAICESRECGNAEHSGEAVCKQISGREERRRELQGL